MKVIERYYDKNSKAYDILVKHSKLVTKKALDIAKRVPELKPDLKFIEEAAMLHDIGIIKTNAPSIGCFGDKKYLCHGVLGAEILKDEGLIKHAKVCDNHIGLGISKEEILANKLPLELKDYIPETIEEEIISLADNFYSKNPNRMHKQLTINEARNSRLKYGEKNVKRFDDICKKYKLV